MSSSNSNITAQALRDTLFPMLDNIIALCEACLNQVDDQWDDEMREDVEAILEGGTGLRKILSDLGDVELTKEMRSAMSHDLRTPTNTIVGYSDLLLDGIDYDLPATIAGDIKTINEQGRALLSRLNTLT